MAQKDEPKRKKASKNDSVPHQTREALNKDRVWLLPRQRDRAYRKANSPFSIPGIDSLVLRPIASYPLWDHRSILIDDNILLINHLGFFGEMYGYDKPDNPDFFIDLKNKLDFFYAEISKRNLSPVLFQDSNAENIFMGGSEKCYVDYEYCIVPLKCLTFFLGHKPALFKLMIAMLNQFFFNDICDILSLGSEMAGYSKNYIIDEVADNFEEEDQESFKIAQHMYSKGGTISNIEQLIIKTRLKFAVQLKKFKPKDPLEFAYYNWIKKAVPILESENRVSDHSFFIWEEDQDFLPVTPELAIRFNWHDSDPGYQYIYDQMQFSHQESGQLYPTKFIDWVNLNEHKRSNFMDLITTFMSEGRDIYFQYFENESQQNQ